MNDLNSLDFPPKRSNDLIIFSQFIDSHLFPEYSWWSIGIQNPHPTFHSLPSTSMYRLIPGLLALAAGVIASDPCNGFVEYCDRKYSDITFLGAHDSEFVGKLPQHDQHDYPETDMDRGFRYFTTQVHLDKGEIRQCHTECFLLNVGPFSDIVNSLKGWLDAHPREVVTLLVTNHDIDVEMFKAAFEANGADKMAFVPDHTLALGEWPTLGQMIDSGKRLVVFMGKFNMFPSAPRLCVIDTEANDSQTTVRTLPKSTTSSLNTTTTSKLPSVPPMTIFSTAISSDQIMATLIPTWFSPTTTSILTLPASSFRHPDKPKIPTRSPILRSRQISACQNTARTLMWSW